MRETKWSGLAAEGLGGLGCRRRGGDDADWGGLLIFNDPSGRRCAARDDQNRGDAGNHFWQGDSRRCDTARRRAACNRGGKDQRGKQPAALGGGAAQQPNQQLDGGRAIELHLAGFLKPLHCVADLRPGEVEPLFHGTQRHLQRGGDFPEGQLVVIVHQHAQALILGQIVNDLHN